VFNKKFDLDYIPPNLKNKPQVICSYIFEGIKDFEGNKVQIDNSAGATVFCGIGEPESFRQLLVREKIIINDFMKFPDHHNFTNKDITKIIDSYNRSASGSLITTQKDFVRIKNSELVLKAKSENLYKNLLFNYPLYYAKIKMQIEKNAEILHKDIDNLLNSE
jgi:tetraacyldisaccharide-1-P 4'-kinase